MKRKIMKLAGLSFALLFSASASAQCLNTNGDMETQTAPLVNSNAWINDHLTNWNVSHGSPNPSASTDIWMWSYPWGGAPTKGEGVYTTYNFVAGQTYELCYDVWRDATSNPVSEFHVEITNGLSPSGGGAYTIPSPTSQALTTQPWTGTGTWVTIVETFTAAANYSQLWFYPRLDAAPTPWQAACRVDNVCIKLATTDPCDFKPRFEATYDEECSVRFSNITSVPVGLTILETTWDFGDGTSGSGMNIDHFYTAGGVYEVCMTIWMINEDGECYQETICMEVDGPECDPCDWLERAEIIVTGTNPFTFTIGGLPGGMYSILGYHWNFGDGTFGTGQTVDHTYIKAGGKEVCVTIYYYDPERRACCSATVCIEVEAKDIKFEEGRGRTDTELKSGVNYEEGIYATDLENFNKIIVLPNPSNGDFEIRLEDGSEIETVHVYDQAGKLVYSTDNPSTNNLLRMNLKQLEKGMYMIIVNEENTLTRTFDKVIIE